MKTTNDNPTRLDIEDSKNQRRYGEVNQLPHLPSFHQYNISISHERKFIWFRVAKVATRSIFRHFKENDIKLDVHQAFSVYYPVNEYDSYFKFAFVRNPWNRLVSCWLDKVVKLNHYGFAVKELEKMKKFENFVEYVSTVDVGNCDPHLKLQSRLIDLNQLDYLGHLETFENDFSQICRHLNIKDGDFPRVNTSISTESRYENYYTPDLYDKVAEIYRKDIQIFNYQYSL